MTKWITIASVAAVVVAFTLISSIQTDNNGNNQNKLRDFKEVLNAARRLESAELLVRDKTAKSGARRNELLSSFAHEVKSAHCKKHYEQLVKVVNEYKVKAYSYVDDCKNDRNNWFMNVVKLGGPMGGMKNLAKFDGNLASITERYERQSSNGQLTDLDVNCDMFKFQIKALNSIMFVLQTDIKYLAVENLQVLNGAIYRQLVTSRMMANNNFYNTEELTPAQRELLLHFYSSRVDLTRTTIGEARERFENIGGLVIGRLLDSCQEVGHFGSIWSQLEAGRADACKKSKSDPMNGRFPAQFNLNKYQDAIRFCEGFLEAL